MPCIILGIIPSIISIFFSIDFLLIFSSLQIGFAGGDLLINVLIIKNKSKKNEQLYFDHPTEVGVVLFDKKEVKNNFTSFFIKNIIK